MNELEKKLAEIQTALAGYVKQAEEQKTLHGTISKETADKIEAMQKQLDGIDAKLAEKHAAGQPEETLEEYLNKDENLKKFMHDRRGNYVIHLNAKQASRLMERKATVTSAAVGAAVSGVLQIDRIPGIVPEARQQLTIRNVLSARPTTMQLIDFVKVNSPMSIASPQTEGSDKAENAVTFEAVSEKVHTLATWIPATRQVLDDMTELMGFLMSSLPYYVDLEEELQILSGSGVGDDYDGLITQAAAFDTSLLSATDGWNRIDEIGYAVSQITSAKELEPTFVALNPSDWWKIRLTKDAHGRYILGDPQQGAGNPDIFGLTPVRTTSLPSGTFLVGTGSPVAAELRDRQELMVEISTQHSDYFVKNLVAIRAEKRGCLVVKRPNSYVTGTFTTSP